MWVFHLVQKKTIPAGQLEHFPLVFQAGLPVTAMPVVVMTQGFVVFLAFCYFACLFLAFFILYLIFEI